MSLFNIKKNGDYKIISILGFKFKIFDAKNHIHILNFTIN